MAETPTIRLTTCVTIRVDDDGHLTRAAVDDAAAGTGGRAAADIAVDALGPVASTEPDALVPLGQWLADAYTGDIRAHGPGAHLLPELVRGAIATERRFRAHDAETRTVLAAARAREEGEHR